MAERRYTVELKQSARRELEKLPSVLIARVVNKSVVRVRHRREVYE